MIADKTITAFQISQVQFINIFGVGTKWSEVINSGITLLCLKSNQTLIFLTNKAELD